MKFMLSIEEGFNVRVLEMAILAALRGFLR